MFTVVDLSQRLPGPYACKRLLNLGASVIRLEDSDAPDPFESDEMKKINPLFYEWYCNINSGKIVEKISLNTNLDYFHTLLNNLPDFSIIIHSLGSKKELEIFKSTQGSEILSRKKHILMSIKASKENPYLHDINALAINGLLDFHSTHFKNHSYIAPPFLPIAGISFGHIIAEKSLELWIKKKNGFHEVFLADEIKESLGLLKGTVDLALHNGLFPSYQIYKTKDGKYAAVALIEEKFWKEFINISNIDLEIEDRFSSNIEIFQKIECYFSTHNASELEDLFQNLSCISIY